MWLNELKVAIVEKNTKKLIELMDNLPQLDNKKDIDSALCLIQEATSLVQDLKDETAAIMKQLKKNIDFLQSTQTQKKNRLDIKS